MNTLTEEGGLINNESLGHFCKIGKEEFSDELDNLDKVMFKCGGCKEELKTICELHEHLLTEFLLGSYLYNHSTRTAFPIHASVSKETQTESPCHVTEDKCVTVDCQHHRKLIGVNDIENHSELLKDGSQVTSDNFRQEDGCEGLKIKKKRKLEKSKKETAHGKKVKKKARPRNSKLCKSENVIDPVEEVNDDLKPSCDSPESQDIVDNQLNAVKEEVMDYNYDESTDENIDNLHDLEFPVNGQSMKKPSIKKVKRQMKMKINSGVKSKKSHKLKKRSSQSNHTLTETTGVDNESVYIDLNHTENDNFLNNNSNDRNFLNNNSNEGTNSAYKECNVKKRGRPRNKTEKFTGTCGHCDTVFHSEKRYNMHLYSVHKALYPFSCKQCNFKPFTNKEDFNEHKEHHPKQVYNCELCGKELKSREGLKLHEYIHSGEKPYCCDQCDYRGRTSTQLRQHMYTHMDSKTEQCEHCGKAFFTKGKLKEHLRYCRKEFNHHCPHCQKGFPTNSGLRKHILMHTGERAFVCDVCGFATFRISLLNSHMRTHTGEKPHKCKECGAKLATRGTLLLHLRTHTHEKPFVCSYCSKAFTSKWNLQTHLRQHTGEKPYKCEICGQGFKQNVLRKAHMRSHLECTSIEPNTDTLTIKDLSTELLTTMEPDNKEHNLQNHMDTLDTREPVSIMGSDRSLEPDKIHMESFVYDRNIDGDMLNQGVPSENLHPLDLKLHFSSGADLKTMYNTSVINSHQLQSTSFDMINYQDIKHV